MISVALETLETLIAIVVPPMLKGKETGTINNSCHRLCGPERSNSSATPSSDHSVSDEEMSYGCDWMGPEPSSSLDAVVGVPASGISIMIDPRFVRASTREVRGTPDEG